MKRLSPVLGVLLLVGACGGAPAPAPDESAATESAAAQAMAQAEADKQVVMEFYRPGITPDERFALIHPDYIQHNAGYVQYAQERDIAASEAFRQIRIAQAQARAAGRAGGGPAPAPAGAPEGNTFHILSNDGDTVVRIARRFASDPQRPGEFYENFWWDTFQVRDGQLYQHWDAALASEEIPAAPDPDAPPLVQEPVPAPAGWPPAAAVPAPGCTTDAATVAANKDTVRAFFGATGQDRVAMLDASYVEHNPAVRRYADDHDLTDLDAFGAFGGVRPLDLTMPAHVDGAPADVMADVAFGACDVVTAIHKHYSPRPGAAGEFYEHYTFDTFRIEDGRIVEHWDGGGLTATPVMPEA